MLSKNQAIRECKELWSEIEKSHLSKFRFMKYPNSPIAQKVADYEVFCPLCEYVKQAFETDCSENQKCPLQEQYGESCMGMGYTGDLTDLTEWYSAVKGLKEDQAPQTLADFNGRDGSWTLYVDRRDRFVLQDKYKKISIFNTGILVRRLNEEIIEVWQTLDPFPFSFQCTYEKVDISLTLSDGIKVINK